MTTDTERVWGRRGLVLLAVASVVSLLMRIAYRALHELYPSAFGVSSSGDESSLFVLLFTVVGVGVLLVRCTGLGALAVLPRMGVAIAAIAALVISAAGVQLVGHVVSGATSGIAQIGFMALGIAGGFLSVATLSRASDRLGGELRAGHVTTLYVTLGLSTAVWLVGKVWRLSLLMVGDSGPNPIVTYLGLPSTILDYGYRVLFISAVIRLLLSVKRA